MDAERNGRKHGRLSTNLCRTQSSMQSKATTVAEYLASLPADRRAALEALRKVFRANLDKDYAEIMQYGMIGYVVPHRVFPPGYHCDPKQPLPFAGLASQKNHMALYLGCVYGGDGNGGEAPEAAWFREAWQKTGKKLDMGKACVRFKRIEDVPLDVVGELIRRVPAKVYVERYVGERDRMASRKAKPAAKQAASSRSAAPARKKATAVSTKKKSASAPSAGKKKTKKTAR